MAGLIGASDPETVPESRKSLFFSLLAGNSTVETGSTTTASATTRSFIGVFGIIKRELRCRSAIEAVIGHFKTDGHLGRCHLKGPQGDAANAVLSAVGHNLRLLLAWLKALLCLVLIAFPQTFSAPPVAQIGFLTGD